MTLGRPAKADQEQLNQVKQQEQKLKQQQEQQTQQLELQGVPEAQAQQQVQQQTASQQQKLDQQKQAGLLTHHRHADRGPPERDQEDAGVQSVSPATLDKAGTSGVFTAIPTTAPSDPKTEDLIKHLRSDVIPNATKGTDEKAFVGGQTAGYIDLADRIADKLPSDDRHRGGAQLHRAAAGVPLAAAAREGGGGQPPLGGRRLRRGDLRVPGGPRRDADRAGGRRRRS